MRKKRLIKANAHLSEALSMQCIMTLICTGYIQKNMAASPSAFNKTLLNIVLVATILNLLYLICNVLKPRLPRQFTKSRMRPHQNWDTLLWNSWIH